MEPRRALPSWTPVRTPDAYLTVKWHFKRFRDFYIKGVIKVI